MRRRLNSDVVIVGGGLVGASLLLALRALPLRTLLIEARAIETRSDFAYDARSTALSSSSCRVLDTLGVWAEVADRAAAIERIHVSERGRFGFCRLDAREFGVPALGHVVENATLHAALWRALQSSGAELLVPAALESIAVDSEAIELSVRSPEGSLRLRTRLLVAADGVRSTVRDLLGLPSRGRHYDQSALVANLTPEQPQPGLAFERFTDSGPLALLPLYDGRYALIWTLPPERAAHTAELPDEQFAAAVQQAFGFRLGRFVKAGRRDVFPLALTIGDQPAAGRVALAGNAAQGLHPVAGQGFNLGLRDAAALADVLADGLAERGAKFDPGDAALLRRYRDWRRSDQRRAVAFTDGLIRLFTNRLGSVALLRNGGMLALDLLPGLKTAFAEHGMGMGTRLPRLARGVPLESIGAGTAQ